MSWYKTSEIKPSIDKGRSKLIIGIDSKNRTHLCYFFPDKFESIDLDDWDDYDPEDYPFTTYDEERERIWLNEGFYETLDCYVCDPHWSSPLDIVHWMNIPEKPHYDNEEKKQS